ENINTPIPPCLSTSMSLYLHVLVPPCLCTSMSLYLHVLVPPCLSTSMSYTSMSLYLHVLVPPCLSTSMSYLAVQSLITKSFTGTLQFIHTLLQSVIISDTVSCSNVISILTVDSLHQDLMLIGCIHLCNLKYACA
uniref:Uncharacterized protein n=1 Tax=Oncorhynchus kisutch TaxID=8019 RepID=A0A8C7CJ90_ONCKI